MVIKDLQNTSKLLSCRDSKNYKVISLVDGGYPLVFWAYSFLEQATLNDNIFNFKTTPIYGISKGDEYFPVIQMAGNLAFIANGLGVYPQNVKQLSIEESSEIREPLIAFKASFSLPK